MRGEEGRGENDTGCIFNLRFTTAPKGHQRSMRFDWNLNYALIGT